MILNKRLIKGDDVNALGLFGRLPLEIREMIYQMSLNVGYIIPCQKPDDDSILCFDYSECCSMPSTSLLCSGWTVNREAKKYLYANNTIVIQGQDSEALGEFIWNLTVDTESIARKFHVRFSWRDVPGSIIGEANFLAISHMKLHGSFTSASRQTRLNNIHDAIRDKLLGFWWSRLYLISHIKFDSLTLDFREATCLDGCCLDLASRLAWMLPKLSHGEPKELRVMANNKHFGRRLKWIFRKRQRRDWM
ncbi:MAG: hypothetical protein FRX48_09036 [Lasallia pustulata]|uniref:2EXR domain-containing protein n=1 Tax=Lasallia pustulata TaxID=136370 RepID=A0A5M8PEA0_9LECA|nr:MAG: hypothetical protein FRX48_09036 [Lasallia pustulata]